MLPNKNAFLIQALNPNVSFLITNRGRARDSPEQRRALPPPKQHGRDWRGIPLNTGGEKPQALGRMGQRGPHRTPRERCWRCCPRFYLGNKPWPLQRGLCSWRGGTAAPKAGGDLPLGAASQRGWGPAAGLGAGARPRQRRGKGEDEALRGVWAPPRALSAAASTSVLYLRPSLAKNLGRMRPLSI